MSEGRRERERSEEGRDIEREITVKKEKSRGRTGVVALTEY